MARYLGPDLFGTYHVALALVSIFAILAPLGLPGILVRELVKQHEISNRLVTTAIVIRICSAFAFYGLLIATTLLLQYSRIELVLVSIMGSKLLFQSFDSVDNYLQANVKLRSSSKIRLIAMIVASAVKLYLVYIEADLIVFAYAYAVEFLVIALLFIWIYPNFTNHWWRFEFDRKKARYLILTALPLIYAAALMNLNMKVDQVMITKLIDNEANGYYSVVVGLIETLYFIPVALGTSLFPGLVKQHAKQSEDYLPSFQFLYEILLLVAAGITFVYFFFAGWIIDLLYGGAYEPSIRILQAYAFAPLLIFFGEMRNRWLIIEDKQRYIAWFFAVALIVNITMNFILLPEIGVQGAVVSLLISYFTAYIIVPCFIPDTRDSVFMFFKAFRFTQTLNKIRHRKI